MSRASWIQLFLYLHILGAIAALGPNLTYALWLARADRRGPEHRPFVLVTTGWIDDHLATPAYVAQAVTGIALILLLSIDFFDTAWLIVGVILYVIMSGVATGAWRPTLRRQTELARAVQERPEDGRIAAEYAEAAARARYLGLAVVALVLAILYFMIVKPPLWSAG